MADPPGAVSPQVVVSTGPLQHGRGVQGQYMSWITQPDVTPDMIQQHQLKTPSDFDRDQFRAVVVQAHADSNVDVLETVCFQEPHGIDHPHNKPPRPSALAVPVETCR